MSIFCELADNAYSGCSPVVGADSRKWGIWGPEKEGYILSPLAPTTSPRIPNCHIALHCNCSLFVPHFQQEVNWSSISSAHLEQRQREIPVSPSSATSISATHDEEASSRKTCSVRTHSRSWYLAQIAWRPSLPRVGRGHVPDFKGKHLRRATLAEERYAQ